MAAENGGGGIEPPASRDSFNEAAANGRGKLVPC